MLSLDVLQTELALIRSKTSQPINVNFFCHTAPRFNAEREQKWRSILKPYFEEYEIDINAIPSGPGREPFSHAAADVLEGFKPEVVSFHFGLPGKDLLSRVKNWGATVISSATTVEEAHWLEANVLMELLLRDLRRADIAVCFCRKSYPFKQEPSNCCQKLFRK